MQANVDYSYVRRRAEWTSLGLRLEHPSIRSDSSLAANRRADALHVVCSTKHTSPARELLLRLVSRDTYQHPRKMRAGRAPLHVLWVRPNPRQPTASCILSTMGRGDCVCASWLYLFIVQRIHSYSYSYLCVYLGLLLLLCQAGSAQLGFHLIKVRYHYSIHVFPILETSYLAVFVLVPPYFLLW